MDEKSNQLDAIACLLFSTTSVIGSVVYFWNSVTSFMPI